LPGIDAERRPWSQRISPAYKVIGRFERDGLDRRQIMPGEHLTVFTHGWI
jgi:hypothetical protein